MLQPPGAEAAASWGQIGQIIALSVCMSLVRHYKLLALDKIFKKCCNSIVRNHQELYYELEIKYSMAKVGRNITW